MPPKTGSQNLPEGDSAQFAAIPHEVVARIPEIGVGPFALAVVLCKYADWRAGTCFPKKATLARDLGKDTKTIQNWTRVLKKAGLVETVKRENSDGSQTSNLYRLRFWNHPGAGGTPVPSSRNGDAPRDGTPIPGPVESAFPHNENQLEQEPFERTTDFRSMDHGGGGTSIPPPLKAANHRGFSKNGDAIWTGRWLQPWNRRDGIQNRDLVEAVTRCQGHRLRRLYAVAVDLRWIVPSGQAELDFLAVCHHCATVAGIENRIGVLVERVKSMTTTGSINTKGTAQASDDWAGRMLARSQRDPELVGARQDG